MEERIITIDKLFLKLVSNVKPQVWIAITNWLHSILVQFESQDRTIALTFSILNTFLSYTRPKTQELQLIASTCASLACSLVEIFSPDDEDFVSAMDNKFTTEQLQQMKVKVVVTLQAKLRAITAIDVLSARRNENDAIALELALLLYMHYPVYFGLSSQKLADLCLEVANHLLFKSDISVLAKRIIVDLQTIQPSDRLPINVISLLKELPILHDELIIPKSRDRTKIVEYKVPKCEELEYISEGSFGTVFKVKCDDVVMALKKQDVTDFALNELCILMTYKHDSIIGVQNFQITSDGIDLYMDLGKSLYDIVMFSSGRIKYWKSTYLTGDINDDLLLPQAQREQYIIDVCRGISYIHSVGIIHLDVKLKNIIVVNGKAKIADFGTSLQAVLSADDQRKKSIHVITRDQRPVELYYQPELHSQYSFEVDVWSLACVVLELLTGITPFYGPIMKDHDEKVTMLRVITKILGTPPYGLYPGFPYHAESTYLKCIKDDFARQTLLAMLNYNPKARLTAEESYERFLTHYR